MVFRLWRKNAPTARDYPEVQIDLWETNPMSIVTRLADFFQDRERAPTERELADMGFTHSDYRYLVTSKDGTRTRMEALAARFGVTPQMIDAHLGLSLELARTCGHCPNSKACQNALDLGVDMDTALCPNATIYADMSAS